MFSMTLSKLLVVAVALTVIAKSVSGSSKCLEHKGNDGESNCCYPRRCPKGTEPVCNGTTESVLCRHCPSGFFMASETPSQEMRPCSPLRTCTPPELAVYQNGSAEQNTVCQCNVVAGYLPRNASMPYGQMRSGECLLTTTTAAPALTQATESSLTDTVPPTNVTQHDSAVGISVSIIACAISLVVTALIIVVKFRRKCRCVQRSEKSSSPPVQAAGIPQQDAEGVNVTEQSSLTATTPAETAHHSVL